MKTGTLYILLSIAVVSIVSAVVLSSKGPAPDKATPAELTAAKLKRLHIQLLKFYSANHRWPMPSRWKEEIKPYLEADGVFSFDKAMVDGWGSQIQYMVNTDSDTAFLYSFGKNRADDHGTNDDLPVTVARP